MEIIREKYLNWLKAEKDTNYIKVITGIRRVGKTTILNQYRRLFVSENVIDIDFNDARVAEQFDWRKLIDFVESKSKPNEVNYVFLDEVQEIKEFEKAVITLFSHKKFKYDIYITGSNSKMFSAELVTLFSGRTSEIQVFPFDFNEICEIFFNHKTNEESLEKYLMQGGIGLVIPEYKDFNLVKKALVKIYASCIKNDIKARHTIRYSESLERLCEYLFNNVGRKVSANNLENYLVSNKEIKISKNTIINYFNWLCDAFLFYKIKYYDIRGKQIMKTKVKYYATDLGMLTLKTSSNIGFNKGFRLENAVLLKLLEDGYEVYTGEDELKHEIDFIVKKDNSIKYIQVCDELNNKNFERESRSLLSTKDAYDKFIITNSISVSQTLGIKILNLSDFLYGESKLDN